METYEVTVTMTKKFVIRGRDEAYAKALGRSVAKNTKSKRTGIVMDEENVVRTVRAELAKEL